MEGWHEELFDRRTACNFRNRAGAAHHPWLAWSVAVVAIACTAVVAFFYFREKPPVPAASLRFQLPVPEGANYGTLLNLSPDGQKLAFIAAGRL